MSSRSFVKWSAAQLVLCALAAWPASTLALATTETEEQRVSRALQSALEKHGGDVNRCFEKALADSLDVAGKVDLEMDVGADGKVTRAEPVGSAASGQAVAAGQGAPGAEPAVTSPVLLACLAESAVAWTIPGVAAGSTVILPLAFTGQMAQFSIKAADAPVRGPGAKKMKGKAAGAGAAFQVKLLVDEATMHARQASLSLLTVAPANRIAMHKHPGAEILYIKKGRARVLGPPRINAEVLAEGSAIFIPAEMPHVIENMVRTASVEILQIFAPMGPERVYRDPADEKGRAAFEVIRDPRKARAPEGARFAVDSWEKATAYPAGKKAKLRLLFEPSSSDSELASLGVLEIEPGGELARHTHEGSAEILYVLQGAGELQIGSEKLPYGADQAIHLPENQPHMIHAKGSEKTLALQIFAPAGPEQQAKGGPSPAAAKK